MNSEGTKVIGKKFYLMETMELIIPLKAENFTRKRIYYLLALWEVLQQAGNWLYGRKYLRAI